MCKYCSIWLVKPECALTIGDFELHLVLRLGVSAVLDDLHLLPVVVHGQLVQRVLRAAALVRRLGACCRRSRPLHIIVNRLSTARGRRDVSTVKTAAINLSRINLNEFWEWKESFYITVYLSNPSCGWFLNEVLKLIINHIYHIFGHISTSHNPVCQSGRKMLIRGHLWDIISDTCRYTTINIPSKWTDLTNVRNVWLSWQHCDAGFEAKSQTVSLQ